MFEPGPRNLITDIDGLLVGNAADERLKSGVTCLLCAAPYVASMHVMGGAPGTRESDMLAPDKMVQKLDAITLAGGSAFGLDAVSGVVEGLHAQGRGFAIGAARVPIVPGAILFDLLNGGDKDWGKNPYTDLGRAAFDAATRDFALGTAGAGTGATTARFKGGLGSASVRLASGHLVGALVAVNPVGCPVVPGGRQFWAAPFEIGDEFGGLGPAPTAPPLNASQTKMGATMGGNTTIAIVATDAVLSKAEAHRMAVAAHDGIARAVVPSHTPYDGDLVYGLATGARPLHDAGVDQMLIGHAAATCLARAIARAVFLARPALGDLVACWQGGDPR